jgi:RNA polymerase sigma-70 factor (ECF subfamily)
MSVGEPTLRAAQSGDESAFAELVAPYRRELRAHCYRMAGSLHEADDLLQESLLRVWSGLPRFEGRSNVRTWLYKVTTNACLDTLERKSARVLPRELGPAAGPEDPIGPPRLDLPWLEPCPEDLYAATEMSPEARYGERESVALAFLVALQLLPAKQRVVLILRDVVGWEATECAELLGLSVAAVNSALQRARETLASRSEAQRASLPTIDDAGTSTLLSRYVQAWELADTSALVALLREDATLAMPPFAEWVAGAEAIGASIGSMVFVPAGPGAFRLVPTEANGQPAFAAYQRDPESGELRATAIHALEIEDGRVVSICAFLDPSLFVKFGLPSVLAA